MSNTLTYEQLKVMVGDIVTAAKLSNGTYSVSRNNVAELVDKIGKIFSIDTNFRQDKLARFNAEFLSYGKTVEEYQADLLEVRDFTGEGTNALVSDSGTFRPPFYSYTIGRKFVKQTIPYGNLERAVHFAAEYVNIIALMYSRIEDSIAQYEYELKREALGRLAGLCATAMGTTTTFAISTAYDVGDYVRKGSSGDDAKVKGIVFKPIAATNTDAWAAAVAAGKIVPIDLEEVLSVPTDEASGEAFIERVKALAEVASDRNQGNSLNGNCLGVTTDLVLIVKQGILPNLQVKTMAGCFQLDQLALPAEVIVVPDFGDDGGNTWGILMDGRGLMLHPTYRASRELLNPESDKLAIYTHVEHTIQASRNTFIHVFKSA